VVENPIEPTEKFFSGVGHVEKTGTGAGGCRLWRCSLVCRVISCHLSGIGPMDGLTGVGFGEWLMDVVI